MEVRRYRLVVSGIVQFDDRDKALEELLLGRRGERDRFLMAIQELEENASDVIVKME